MEGATYVVKAADLAGLMTTFTANAEVIVPAGIGLVVAMAGVRLIPKLIKNFARG